MAMTEATIEAVRRSESPIIIGDADIYLMLLKAARRGHSRMAAQLYVSYEETSESSLDDDTVSSPTCSCTRLR